MVPEVVFREVAGRLDLSRTVVYINYSWATSDRVTGSDTSDGSRRLLR